MLDYQRPQTTRSAPRTGEDVCLFCAFALYATVNFAVVTFSRPLLLDPRSVLLAFAVPLPLLFIILVIVARFIAKPPLFSGRAVLVFVFLVLAVAVLNFLVADFVQAMRSA